MTRAERREHGALMRSRLTYANVMATIAVFLALGGSSYAVVSITGRDVRNGSLTGADVKNSSLTGIDIRNRSLHAVDFKLGELPQGPQGVQGPQGPKGDPGATKAVVRTSSALGQAVTLCQPGETATGGGGSSPDGYVVASGPTSHPTALFAPNGPPAAYPGSTAWESRAVKVVDSGGTLSEQPADVTTWVVCVSP
jgi:hypothetical protein